MTKRERDRTGERENEIVWGMGLTIRRKLMSIEIESKRDMVSEPERQKARRQETVERRQDVLEQGKRQI